MKWNIYKYKRNNAINKDGYKRLILLHPYLIDKVNKKMKDMDLNYRTLKKKT